MTFHDIDAIQNHFASSFDICHELPEVLVGFSIEHSAFVSAFGCILYHVASALLRFLKQ